MHLLQKYTDSAKKTYFFHFNSAKKTSYILIQLNETWISKNSLNLIKMLSTRGDKSLKSKKEEQFFKNLKEKERLFEIHNEVHLKIYKNRIVITN